MSTKIGKDTWVSVGLVLAIVAGVFSYGIMYQKVESLTSEVSMLRQKTDLMNTKLDTLIGQLKLAAYVP